MLAVTAYLEALLAEPDVIVLRKETPHETRHRVYRALLIKVGAQMCEAWLEHRQQTNELIDFAAVARRGLLQELDLGNGRIKGGEKEADYHS